MADESSTPNISSKKMTYILMPSLERMALIRANITLWNQYEQDISILTEDFCFRCSFISAKLKRWQVIEDKVIKKVQTLPLPESIKKKVIDLTKPTGLEILKWMGNHQTFFSENTSVSERFNWLCWTPQGLVDKKKTAEALIQDENLEIDRRYKLACTYYLEDDIQILLNQIIEKSRRSFDSGKDPESLEQEEQDLIAYWNFDILGEATMLSNRISSSWENKCTPYQYAFEFAADGGNKVATVYFLQKLTPKERKESLVRTAGNVAKRRWKAYVNYLSKEDYADVLCFLLSQMSDEQQMDVYKSNPKQVLWCLLDCPWQSFFMETANRMRTFLTLKDYIDLLWFIVIKVKESKNSFQQLCGEFWQQCPSDYKKYILMFECTTGSILPMLFRAEDEENIKLIFKDATAIEREKIFFSDVGKSIYECLFCSEKWYLLKFFVENCVTSKEKMVQFKTEIIPHISKGTRERRDLFRKFIQILDDFIREYDKRKDLEEGEISPAKKRCSASGKASRRRKRGVKK